MCIKRLKGSPLDENPWKERIRTFGINFSTIILRQLGSGRGISAGFAEWYVAEQFRKE